MTTCYISCACNRVPHSADWGNNGLVCYGACNAVAIYDPSKSKTGRVVLTLQKHTNQVSVVRWIKTVDSAPETELLSAAVDGTAIIWTRTKNSFEPTSVLRGDSALTIAVALYVDNVTDGSVGLLVCTGSVNGELKIWGRSETGETECIQTLTFGRKLAIEACLWFLPNSKVPLIAVAMEDSSIRLFSMASEGGSFVQMQSLVGHEDWVRCLDFTNDENGDVLLASGSQDNMIRLWRISPDEESEMTEELKQKKQQFRVEDRKYNVALESILISHEGWVYGVNWHPTILKDGKYQRPMKLLSCSLDKTMILWEPNVDSGVWLESVRVGEVGGNSLGFYGCKFGPNGKSLLAHGYQGSFHIWKFSEDTGNWAPRTAPSGHFREVVDLCWDSRGRFLMTASLDQTTRIHAPWKFESGESWHEIGRPQVHGYDMSCLAMLTPYMFASGAEEKVVRTFTAPATFVNYLRKIATADDFEGSLAESASVPALGLTNKAVFDGENASGENLFVGNSKDLNYEQPPTEEELIQHTLWPELQKLYGHGYEVFSMAAKHDGSLLATACKSTSPEHSAIILWSTKSWSQVQKLMSHQLTVTQMAFSPNDAFLLSVSRDRRWSLFKCSEDGFNLVAASSKKDSLHARIIWCCAWTHDSKYFATGSRDGKIGIWSPAIKEPKELLPTTSLDEKDNSITALAFAPFGVSENSYILAIGYDNGNIEVQKIIFEGDSITWRKYEMYQRSFAHHLTVKRLSFRPRNDSSDGTLELASCGNDCTVKILSFKVEELSKL